MQVLSAWSGLRPLVKDPGAKNTESLVRNHMINVSKSGLLTIAGGKWTTCVLSPLLLPSSLLPSPLPILSPPLPSPSLRY